MLFVGVGLGVRRWSFGVLVGCLCVGGWEMIGYGFEEVCGVGGRCLGLKLVVVYLFYLMVVLFVFLFFIGVLKGVESSIFGVDGGGVRVEVLWLYMG